MTTPRMIVWQAPSGRLHRLRGCTGGAAQHMMHKVLVTEHQFDLSVRCDCLRSFRETVSTTKGKKP